MNIDFITLTKDNIEKEHICCAFSDKKCQESYNLKKEWLKKQFENGYVFRRLNELSLIHIFSVDNGYDCTWDGNKH